MENLNQQPSKSENFGNLFLEETILNFYTEFQKTGKQVFEIDPVYFKGVAIFFNITPAHVLFPYPSIEGVSVCVGALEKKS